MNGRFTSVFLPSIVLLFIPPFGKPTAHQYHHALDCTTAFADTDIFHMARTAKPHKGVAVSQISKFIPWPIFGIAHRLLY